MELRTFATRFEALARSGGVRDGGRGTTTVVGIVTATLQACREGR